MPTGQPQKAGSNVHGVTAGHVQLGAFGRRFARAAAERQSADLGDRCQRFPAKAQRGHAKQVVGVLDLAGGMAGHGQWQFVRHEPQPSSLTRIEARAPLLHRYVDPRGSGVDSGFSINSLTTLAGRSDHLARGNVC